MSSLGRYGIHHVNDSGRRFQSYLEMNNHIALTTYFQKKTYMELGFTHSLNLSIKLTILLNLKPIFLASVIQV